MYHNVLKCHHGGLPICNHFSTSKCVLLYFFFLQSKENCSNYSICVPLIISQTNCICYVNDIGNIVSFGRRAKTASGNQTIVMASQTLLCYQN